MIHAVLCNDGFTAWSSISQMKFLSAKKNPTSWPHQETLIWNLKQKSNNIASPFSKSPTCLASSAIRSHLSHQLTKTQGSLPQPVSWGGCLPSILAYRALASSKGGDELWISAAESFFFIPYPPPSVHGAVFFSRLQLSHQKLVFTMMDPFQFIRDRGNKNICYDFRLRAKQLCFQQTGCSFVCRTMPVALPHKFHKQRIWFQIDAKYCCCASGSGKSVFHQLLRNCWGVGVWTVLIILQECDHFWIIYPAWDEKMRPWDMLHLEELELKLKEWWGVADGATRRTSGITVWMMARP